MPVVTHHRAVETTQAIRAVSTEGGQVAGKLIAVLHQSYASSPRIASRQGSKSCVVSGAVGLTRSQA